MFFTTPFKPCGELKYRLAAFIKGARKGAKSKEPWARHLALMLMIRLHVVCRLTQRLTSANLACKRNGDWSKTKTKKIVAKRRHKHTYIFIQQVWWTWRNAFIPVCQINKTFVSSIGNQFPFGQTNATKIVLNYFATILTFEGNSLAIFRTPALAK